MEGEGLGAWLAEGLLEIRQCSGVQAKAREHAASLLHAPCLQAFLTEVQTHSLFALQALVAIRGLGSSPGSTRWIAGSAIVPHQPIAEQPCVAAASARVCSTPCLLLPLLLLLLPLLLLLTQLLLLAEPHGGPLRPQPWPELAVRREDAVSSREERYGLGAGQLQ